MGQHKIILLTYFIVIIIIIIIIAGKPLTGAVCVLYPGQVAMLSSIRG